MAIQRQEFYEGAAIHQLIRGTSGATIAYLPPFFLLDGWLQVYLKYSTAKRSPWGFTFMPDEQVLLGERAQMMPLVIGLICGADGIAALSYDDYVRVAAPKRTALHVSCRRKHREHFQIGGPDGVLTEKVAPSDWMKILNKREQ